MTHPFDYVIVGQGLAGTTLAWHLRWAGLRAAVIDREASVTSSRVAAGLMTPITGRRLALSWRFREFFPVAEAFFRRVEAATATRFFTRRPVVRLFRDVREQAIFAERANAEFHGLVGSGPPVLDERWFAAPLGGFEMTAAAQLDATAYLDASRESFARAGEYFTGEVRPETDVELHPGGIRLPQFGLKARSVIYCQGIDSVTNPWFRALQFNPAKGEILTLSIPGLTEDRVINRGVWLASTGDGSYRAGSTYDRDHLDCTPTAGGRDEICSRLRTFLRLPFEVIGHAAAVRPIAGEQKPILGLLASDPRIGLFNGLGSKGSLHAPFFAGQFAGFLAGGSAIDPEVDIRMALGR